MTQAQLAKRCSSRSSLVAYEAGQSEPKVTVLLGILRALGKDLHDFATAYDRAERRGAAGADRRRDDPEAGSSLKGLALRGRRVELGASGTSLAQTPEGAGRAFFVVDLSEGAHETEEPLMLQELLDRLTTFTHRQAAVKEREQRHDRCDSNVADENPLQASGPGLEAKATR